MRAEERPASKAVFRYLWRRTRVEKSYFRHLTRMLRRSCASSSLVFPSSSSLGPALNPSGEISLDAELSTYGYPFLTDAYGQVSILSLWLLLAATLVWFLSLRGSKTAINVKPAAVF